MEGCERYFSKDGETTIYTRDGKVVAKCIKYAGREEWYNANGKNHRDGQPAVIFYENDQKTGEFWYHDGKLHRDGDMPAAIHYKNGQITMEIWYHDGKYHRDGQPSVIWYENGQKTREIWHRDGKYHRDGDMPAVIHYKNDQITREYWYRDGVEYIPEKPKVDPITEQLAIIETALAKIREEIAKK